MPYSAGPEEQDEPDASSMVEDEGSGSDESLFIPSDCLGGKDFSAGDTITLKVIGKNSDGDLEVSMGGGDEEDMGSDEADKMELRAALGFLVPA